ncbi:Hydroxylysine kinase, partial [Nibea albiflora]
LPECADTTAVVESRPSLTIKQATELTLQLYGIAITEVFTLPSYSDQNFLMVNNDGTKYVLKIMNSAENCGHGAQTYCVRLMMYIHGKTVAESPVTTQDVYHIGKLAATLDKTLEQLVSLNLDVLQSHDTPWSLSNIPLLEAYLSVMDGNPLQEVLNVSVFSFTGIIHGDLNDQNIIVTPLASGHHEISGIIDFSLLMNGCYVFELAITIMYLMLENPNPLDVGGPLIAGWESIMPLSDDERDSLYLLVLGRLCQSLVHGQYYSRKYPDNKEYILTTARNGFQILAKLWEMGKEEAYRMFSVVQEEYLRGYLKFRLASEVKQFLPYLFSPQSQYAAFRSFQTCFLVHMNDGGLSEASVGGAVLACRLEGLRQRQGLVDVEVEVKGMERARELAGGRENGREPGVSGPDSFSLQALCLQTALKIRKTGSISRAWLKPTAVCKLVPAAQKQSAPFPTNHIGRILQCTSCRH